ncbi:hypothetical protein, partial [Nostocoides japonicum]|uniref:hypothetical protein n=1 Tax=Nostocoides japonicum TaxID=99481 RepID=UPI00065B7594
RTGEWDSPAGRLFASRVGEVPQTLLAVARRYSGAATILRTYAAALADAQEDARCAAWRFASASATVDELNRRLWSGPDEATRRSLELERVQWLPCLDTARAAWQAARSRLDEADRRCGAGLRDLADDAIADPALYRILHRTRTAATGVSAMGLVPTPWTKAGGVVAGGVSTAATVGLKALYGEGSWRSIAGQEAVTAGLAGARVLRASSAARAVTRDGVRRPLTTAERLAIGSKEQLWTKAPWRLPPPPADPRLVRIRPPATGGRITRTMTKVQRVAADQWRARVADDWQRATLSGPGGRRLLLAAWGVEGTTKTATRVRAPADPHDDGRR